MSGRSGTLQAVQTSAAPPPFDGSTTWSLLLYEPPMNERCQHRPLKWGSHQRALVHAWCSPYQGPGIDISWTPSPYPPECQATTEMPPKSSLLHIPPSISPNSPSLPSFLSPYPGGDLDINGGTILNRTEPQPVTSSTVRTAVHHIAPPTQHTGAHHRQQPAPRGSDRSGTPQAGNPAEEYSGERDPEALGGGTPKGTIQTATGLHFNSLEFAGIENSARKPNQTN